MTSQPNITNPQWQKILDAALAGARDDAREQVGDAICEAYSLGIAVGLERQNVQPMPRRVPTMAERLSAASACGHTPGQHRHTDGQDNDAASHDRAMRVLAAERDAITAENTQWQAEVAHLRDLIRQYGDDGKIPVSAISKALRDGPPTPLGSVSPHAQDDIRPAAWEHHAIDAAAAGLGEAWSMLATDPTAARRLATAAVRAIIDADLAGLGGRCRRCGATYPRTLPAGQDPLCWTCGSEEQTGPEPDAAEQVLRDRVESAIRNRLDATYPIQLVNDETLDQVAAVAAVAAVNELRQG